ARPPPARSGGRRSALLLCQKKQLGLELPTCRAPGRSADRGPPQPTGFNPGLIATGRQRPRKDERLDVFDLRDRLIGRYSDYVRSFLRIREPRTRAFVEAYLGEGNLWPEP